jgi:DNA-binding NtrC family response regulator
VKGAFTNAVRHREGRFSLAHGGTIFLDEIGDMSPNLQVKLLRVLQERTFEPVGSSKTTKVDVRIIAATHQDLPQLIDQRRFREDLYYRLNVLPIEVPSLRERIEDLPLLVHHFLDLARQERGSHVEAVTEDAMQRMMDYHWPGNIRELENLTERLTVLVSEGEIHIEDLPGHIRADPASQPWAPRVPSTGINFNAVVGRFETDLIEQALEQTHWNKNRAAKLLELNRTTLIEKIKKRGISRDGD